MERSVAALNRIRSILLAAMALFCVLTLSGCIAKTVDELYALPRHSDEYYELQKAIDGVMTEGVQYAAPVSTERTRPSFSSGRREKIRSAPAFLILWTGTMN